jgi:hypothetical protein
MEESFALEAKQGGKAEGRREEDAMTRRLFLQSKEAQHGSKSSLDQISLLVLLHSQG